MHPYICNPIHQPLWTFTLSFIQLQPGALLTICMPTWHAWKRTHVHQLFGVPHMLWANFITRHARILRAIDASIQQCIYIYKNDRRACIQVEQGIGMIANRVPPYLVFSILWSIVFIFCCMLSYCSETVVLSFFYFPTIVFRKKLVALCCQCCLSLFILVALFPKCSLQDRKDTVLSASCHRFRTSRCAGWMIGW